MARRPLAWRRAHPASARCLYGLDGTRLVGQAITYDGERWAALVRFERVGEQWYPSAEAATAAVDELWKPESGKAAPVGVRQPGWWA